jgi:glycine dehydrogenase subunit 2
VKDGGRYRLDDNRPQSVGKVRSFFGNYGALVMAYIYMTQLGRAGVRRMSENAVLGANYIRVKLRELYHVHHDRVNAHEVVFTDRRQDKENGVHTLDIAKRLIDYGIHPMTIYFPLPQNTGGYGAMMVEPTETESKETLDYFIEVMGKIAIECRENPELVKTAPHTTPVSRVDEKTASTRPQLYCAWCLG